MNALRAAVIGTGFIGPVHVEALRRIGVEVLGILGSSPEKSTAAAKSLGLARPYASVADLLADPDVDVVHIASPNRLHFQHARDAIAAGKHVLCEKPLAMTSAESEQLVALAKNSHVACGVNYNIRYYPLCIEAAQRVANGDLGRLFHVTGSYVQDWLFHPADFNWRVLSDEGGVLRAVADIGTHWLDLTQHICRQHVTSVCADLVTVFPERERPKGGAETFTTGTRSVGATETVNVTTEDYGAIMLRFSEGAHGVLWVSQVTAGRKNTLQFELAGANCSLRFDSESPNNLVVGHRHHPNQLLPKDPSLLSASAANACSYPGGHQEGFGDTFKQLFADFYRAIDDQRFGDDATFPTFEDGHRELLICDAIWQSHQQHAWVQVGEIDR